MTGECRWWGLEEERERDRRSLEMDRKGIAEEGSDY